MLSTDLSAPSNTLLWCLVMVVSHQELLQRY
jgi:hypothetical protein